MKKQTREEWLLERREYIGASEAASVINAGKYGCALKLFNTKTGVIPDFDDSDKAEFRRGRRLENVAAAYYAEVTGRNVLMAVQQFVPGKKHLRVSMDRVVYKKEDLNKTNPGYLEIKCVGRFSMNAIKKHGLPEDYLIQTQFGLAITGYSWGAFAVYSPETDELLHFDFQADKHLGNLLLEKADDFWFLNIALGIPPERLPEGSKQCGGCPYEYSCWNCGTVKETAIGVIERPDLAPLVARLAEVKGMSSEADDAAESLREEILAAIKEIPGNYVSGKYAFKFSANVTKRFSGDLLKKKDPALYESFRVESITKTLSKPKEI